MENASKALIIAGAILLSILLISLGIIVYQNAQQAIAGANMDKTAIDSFNSQWSGYLGTNKKLSEVKSMLSAVASNNSVEQNGEGRIIEVKVSGSDDSEGKTKAADINKLASGWKANITYKIEADYNDDTGLLTSVTITKNSGTSSDD